MYQSFAINRDGTLTALNSKKEEGAYLATCENRGDASLHALDAKQNSTDPREILAVLARQVAVVSAAYNGTLDTRFEAEVRNVRACVQRLYELCLGRKATA